MKLLFIVVICIYCFGCSSILYTNQEGSVVEIKRFLLKTGIEDFSVYKNDNGIGVDMTGYDQSSDLETIEQFSERLIRGAVKGTIPQH